MSGRDRGTKYIWYAPDVKRIILTKPSWRRGEELISYKLADQKTPPDEEGALPRIREIVLTSGLDKNNNPKDDLKEFPKTQDNYFYIYIYVKWENLKREKSYIVNYTIIDEDGYKSSGPFGWTKRPHSRIRNTWHKMLVPSKPGKYRAEVALDFEKVGERSFVVIEK